MPGARVSFELPCPLAIGVIEMLFKDKTISIGVEDNFGYQYYVDAQQINSLKKYFKQYCSDLNDLIKRYELYGE